MEFVRPGFRFEHEVNGLAILKRIERAGRTCYKSEDKITANSAPTFVAMIMGRGHESVLEHASVSVRFICDRGVTHELVRHRLDAFSQESTRYCNYKSKGVKVIKPFFFIDRAEQLAIWLEVMEACERGYLKLIAAGAKPEEARSVPPNSLKTEIVMTCNLRQWRHVLQLRTTRRAHPQMREIMVPLLAEFKKRIPVVFDDIIAEE